MQNLVEEPLWRLSTYPAGTYIQFCCPATQIFVKWWMEGAEPSSARHAFMPEVGVSGIDCYGRDRARRWQWVGCVAATGETEGEGALSRLGLDGKEREYRIYLPLMRRVTDCKVGVRESITPVALETQRSIAYYGTSIVHGTGVGRPGLTHAAQIGRALDREVLNLGFNGRAHCENAVADAFSQLDSALYVVDVLPNNSADEIHLRLPRFIRRVRSVRPHRPMLLVSDRKFGDASFSPQRSTDFHAKNHALATVVEQLCAEGYEQLHLTTHENWYGSDSEGTNDASHPKRSWCHAHGGFAATTYLTPSSGGFNMKQLHTDIAVYGATPGGIAAACTAAESGAAVVIIDPGLVVGGHLTSGICTTECEHMLPESFGGWMMTFLGALGRYYGLDYPIHRWEPHAALEVYRSLLDRAGVRVELGAQLKDVVVEGERIVAARMNEFTIDAKYWIDAGYEGDLMAGAGVSYVVGREPIDTYNESLAGIRFIDSLEEIRNSLGHANLIDEIWEAPLTNVDGSYIEGVTPPDPLLQERGRGDGKVMNYHYRVTATRAANRIPFPRPPAYREERFELLSRWLHTNPETSLQDIVQFLNHPSGSYAQAPNGFTRVTPGEKWELNNKQASILSLGYLGGQFDYPDGDPETRRRVLEDHFEHNAGLLYFLGNGAGVPRKLREETRAWGLPPDEYPDNDHWPYQPYIRETRRMVGQYVLRQADILGDRRKQDTVFPNSHWIDCHHVERLALDPNHFRNEGRIWKEITKPYDIPYRSLVPRGEECTNLIVPGCVSASHVAFCSVRLESTWMGLGEAAARAAVLALEGDRDVQTIDVPTLQERLNASGVRLAV